MAPPTQPANGVLPAPAILKKKDAFATTGTSRAGRKPAERLKGVVRRLPPGLTQTEFEAVLGEEWKVGAGKVNWLDYKPGKISTDFSKPSRPSRAYVNVLEFSHLEALDRIVMQSNWVDAKKTHTDAALIAPPRLELAAYARVPLGKRRTDARQGTIDQDPEFIDFLQSLTNPVTKPAALDAEPAPKKEEVKTTPLIEHLREKKAAKEKAGKSGKAKQQQQQETKEATKSDKANRKGAKGTSQAAAAEAQDKPKKLTKAEKAAKEAVKVLNKEASAVTEKSANAQPAVKETPERKPERAARPISVAARIQQDLGLSPAARRAQREAKAENGAATPTASSVEATPAPTPAAETPKKNPRGGGGGRGQKTAEKPVAESSAGTAKPVPTGPAQPTLLKKPAQPPKGPASAQPTPPKGPKAQQAPVQPSAVSSSAASADPASLPRQAFLKHANPSQGITEPLIEEALKSYGAVEKVEIDRKKGFAYVDFADNEGMKKAIAASPIKVAQGAVEVKERKEKGTQQQGGGNRGAPSAPMGMQRGPGGAGFRGGRRGGRTGGRGGGAAAGGGSPSPANAAPAPSSTASTAAASSGS